MAGGVGAAVALDGPEHAVFFGEDQGRYVATTAPEATEAVIAEAARAGVPVVRIGVDRRRRAETRAAPRRSRLPRWSKPTKAGSRG